MTQQTPAGPDIPDTVRRLVTLQEGQVDQIAGVIHDGPLQTVAAAYMRLQLLRRRLTSAPDIQSCAEIEETLKLSVLGLRRMLVELVPPRPARAGLLDALGDYLEQTATDTGLTCTLEGPTPAGAAGTPHPLAFRMAQEAVTRLRQRPGVRRLIVGIREAGGGIEVRVLADALGWSPSAAIAGDEPSRPPDVWVATLQEWALIAGGWCRKEAEPAAPGQAEAVTFWLPLWSPPQHPAPAGPHPTQRDDAGNGQDQN